MARWYLVSVLALTAVTAQAQRVQPGSDIKPGFDAPAPTYVVPAPAYPERYVVPGPELAPAYAGRPVLRPSPSDPYAGVTMPNQSGDAAYQGGGMVLEQDDNGVNRRVR